jgi:hypothetical protein
MTRRFAGAVATAGMLMLLGPTAAMADPGRTDVILGGSESAVDYHAEAAPAKPADGGATIIGGNIQIVSDRGARGGLAGACDPDPRFGTHPRPDDEGCTWDEPVGTGEDFIAFGRHIAQQDFTPDGSGDTGSSGVSGDLSGDTDSSPDGAYVPVTTPTRESFNGRGGLDKDGSLFIENRPLLDDEDLNFRITGTSISNYLAPQGNPNNRWRRLCGEGYVSTLSNNGPNLGPFSDGDTVPFVVQIWDADWKDPSDLDGGNQDYFIIDVFPQGTQFDVHSCRAIVPDNPPPPPPPPNNPPAPNPPAPPAPNPAPVAAQPAGAVAGITVRRGTARIAGVSTCSRTVPVPLRVSGRQIRRVTFFVDGRRVATVTRADRAGRFVTTVNPRRLRAGVHRVRARVQFRSGAGPSRTLNMSFRSCTVAVRQVAPQFTG